MKLDDIMYNPDDLTECIIESMKYFTPDRLFRASIDLTPEGFRDYVKAWVENVWEPYRFKKLRDEKNE